MTRFIGAPTPRFIAVAGPSTDTTKEWRIVRPGYNPPPIHQDYALMKVLSMLRLKSQTERYVVHPFKWEEQKPTPLDFSSLEDSDVIFIVGHGFQNGLHAMGPNADKNIDRLLKILTGDGNLKKKRKDKDITILLLSCLSGFGYHKEVAQGLFTALGRDLTVVGAIGFTFGSTLTPVQALNEVLIKGIPWFIEFPLSITKREAEKETEKREKKKIKYDDKKKEINAFVEEKEKIEKALKDIVNKLKSTEVNPALDEIEKNFDVWRGLIMWQWKLYMGAKKESNLEFDMWHNPITDGYVWTTGKEVTAAEAAKLATGTLTVFNDEGASIK